MIESFEKLLWEKICSQAKAILQRPENYCRLKDSYDLRATASLRLRSEPTFGVSRSVSVLASRRDLGDAGFEAVMAVWNKRYDERRILDPVQSLALVGQPDIKPTIDFRVGYVADEKVSQFLAHLATLKVGSFKLRPSLCIDCTEWSCEFNDGSSAISLSWINDGPGNWSPFTKIVNNFLDDSERTLSFFSEN